MCRHLVLPLIINALAITTAQARPSQSDIICAGPDGRTRVASLTRAAAAARFTMHIDGSFELANRMTDAMSFRFPDLDSKGGVVRIDVRHAGVTTATYCGTASADGAYEVSSTEGDLVVVNLYANVRVDGIADERKAVLAVAERAERHAVHALVGIADLVAAIDDAHTRSPDPVKLADIETHRGRDTATKLRALAEQWKCPSGPVDQPMAAAICEEVAQLAAVVSEVLAIVHRAATRVRQLDGDPALFKDYYELLPALVGKLDPGEFADRTAQCTTLAKLRWLDAKDMFRIAARATIPAVPRDRLAFVNYNGSPLARSAADVTRAWGLAMARTPTGTKVEFASHSGKALSVDPAVAITALVQPAFGMIVAGTSATIKLQNLSESARAVAAKNIELMRMLGTDSLVCTDGATRAYSELQGIGDVLDQHAMKKQPLSRELLAPYLDSTIALHKTHADWEVLLDSTSIEKTIDVEKFKQELDAQRPYAAELDKLTSAFSVEGLTPEAIENLAKTMNVPSIPAWAVDMDLPPAAKLETVGQVFVGLDRTHVEDLVACSGEPCTGADDDKTVRGRATLVPNRTGSWTLLVEATLGIGIASRYSHWPDFSTRTFTDRFDIESAPSFDAVGRGDGPDQIYRLEQHPDPRNAVSTGVLLGRYVADRWLIGVGPALLVGTSGGAFSQWDARAAYRISDHGVFLTFGPSVRYLPVPVDYAIGDTVSVPKSSTGAAPPPSGRTYYAAEVQFDIGLGLDIGTLGTAAADTIKAVGGSKK